MRALLRGLRGDLRLALRPACLLVLAGLVLISGLSSAVTQSTASEQLQIARTAVEQQIWKHARCGDRTPACQARARADDHRFLADQQSVARRVAALQTPAGTVQFAAGVTGLGAGIGTVALLATLVLAGEWSRGTIGLALAGGVRPQALAARRFVALFVLALLALGCSALGAAVAAAWGAQAHSLPAATAGTPVRPLAGVVAIATAYSAVGAAVAWVVRDALRTLLLTVAALGLIAATTPLGAGAPGAAITTALGIHQRLEFEIGYVWVWPDLTFSTEGASPVHAVSGPPWGIAIATIAAMTAIALLCLHRRAVRTDPIG